ncbi:MAG: enoyl-CoA hydratase/isomerase family protein [Chloroflexi bacterium]|nr:enoyl-CoA hydratase/isomerase family protein [Chloroflexota bacterium]
MAFQFIRSETSEGVLTLTLDDPKTRNSLGSEMNAELQQEFDRFESDHTLRVLVLTGADPSFCSGANVRGFDEGIRRREQAAPQEASPWERLDPAYFAHTAPRQAGAAIVQRIYNLQKPTIAAVNGHAYGIGNGLAIACDIRIASEQARFCEVFLRRGLISADGSCWMLPRLVGLSNTLLMQYSGEPVDGAEAFRIGLANRVVPHGGLMDATLELAEKLAKLPTVSQSLMKLMVHKALTQSFREHMEEVGRAQAIAQQTEDHKEGVRAFLEKRNPVFVGR